MKLPIKRILFMMVFNLSMASTTYGQATNVGAQIGEKCAELASSSGAVCTTEKAAISTISENSENNETTMAIRSNYKVE